MYSETTRRSSLTGRALPCKEDGRGSSPRGGPTDEEIEMTQLGDIVLYQLTEDDAASINRRYGHTIHNLDMMRIRKDGYQAHFGSKVHTGEPFPMIVTRLWSSLCVNGQVILDGNDSLWVNSAYEGEGPGYWVHRI